MKKQIACIGQRGGPSLQGKSSWNLYVVDTEQASFQQVTFDLLIPRFTWSPDGHLIAFIAWSMVGGKRVETLYLLELNSAKLRCLTDGKGRILWNWSPDGKQIAFTCIEDDCTVIWPSSRGGLFVMNIERDEIRQLTREVAYLVWSQETNDIAFLWQHENHTIAVMNADDINRRLLFHNRLVISPYSWSPDGKFLACHVVSRSQWGAEYKDFDRLSILISREISCTKGIGG